MTQTISTGALLLSTNLKTKATLKKNATSTHAQTFSGKNKKKTFIWFTLHLCLIIKV